MYVKLRMFPHIQFIVFQGGDSVSVAASEAVDDALKDISSRTFLPLIYQLASRISANANNDAERLFQRVLQRLLFDAMCQLPQQSLWTLLALANGSRLPESQVSSFYCVSKNIIELLQS